MVLDGGEQFLTEVVTGELAADIEGDDGGRGAKSALQHREGHPPTELLHAAGARHRAAVKYEPGLAIERLGTGVTDRAPKSYAVRTTRLQVFHRSTK